MKVSFFLLFLFICLTFPLYAGNEQTGTEESFSFCLIADPHASEPAGHLRQGYYQYGDGVDKFFACIKEIRKLPDEEKPDFIMILGDVHLWALGRYLDEVKIPIHVISGNAETRKRKKEMRAFFPADFQKNGEESDYYAFVHKGVRFICLCNARGQEHIGMLCSEDIIPRGQIEWLENQLAEKEPNKIIFAHVPTEPGGQDKNMYMCRNDSRYFNKLVEQTQPTAVFFGHLHRATHKYKIGKSLLCTLRSCTWNLDRTPLGFMMVTMSTEGISTREIITGSCIKPAPRKPSKQGANCLIYAVEATTNNRIPPGDYPIEAEIGNNLAFVATPGEFEPGSFVVRARKNIEKLTFTVSDFKSSDNLIPNSAMDIRIVKDAATLGPVNIDAGMNKQFWLTLKVPKNTTAGNYQGTIELESSKGYIGKVNIDIRVLPFSGIESAVVSIRETAQIGNWGTGYNSAMESLLCVGPVHRECVLPRHRLVF